MNNTSVVTGPVPLTKRAQEAWIKRAVTAGLSEADARLTVQKMAGTTANQSTSVVKHSPVVVPTKNVTLEVEQLPLFPDLMRQLPEVMRSLPNEIIRSALFNARNRKQRRQQLKNEPIAVIGDGRITYTGEELRQDDETVWLQLVHLAKQHMAGQLVEFTAYSFCKNIEWSISKRSYDRLRDSLRRMQATSLSVYSARLGRGVSLSMIPLFEYEDSETRASLPRWRVRVAPELVGLFGDNCFTKIEWAQRLSLPDGLATWLHGYLASHRVPHPIRIETIARGAGLTETDKAALRRLTKNALNKLIDCGFLLAFVVKDDLVTVKRATASAIPQSES